jgi:uncharacterized lipoprotein
MKLRLVLLMTCVSVLASCSGAKPCEEVRPYNSSQLAEPVQVPDDLDSLQAQKELKIPEPSPRPPRPEGAGCLESPPAYSSSSN